MKFCQIILTLALTACSSWLAAAERLHVLWLMHDDNPFWKQSQTIAREAAKDLGVELELLLSTPGDRLSPARQLEQALQGYQAQKGRRSFLVSFGDFAEADKILELAERKGVPVFFYNTPPQFDFTPRQGKYKNILGAMFPDDEQAGYEQAKALIAEAQRRQYPSPHHLIALGGWSRDTVDEERRRGLLKAAAEEGAVVDQYFHTRWDKEIARSHILRARQKFPATRLYWNIADYMGLGTLEWLSKDAQELLVGGIDWSPEAFASLEKEHGLFVTVGGHFLEPAWVMALLYDYAQGIDFLDVYPSGVARSTMRVMDRRSVKAFVKDFPDGAWGKLDFRVLTRSFSKQKSYDFRIERLTKS